MMYPRAITAGAALLATILQSHAALALPRRDTSPVVKLDGDLINISGDQGGGYPRAILTHDGTLLASYSSPGKGILVRASHNKGASWENATTVLAAHTRTDENNAFLFQKTSGDILCAYRRHIRNEAGVITHLNLDVSFSKNSGKSWNVLSSIVSETPTAGVIKGDWEPFLLNSIEDNLEVYWSRELNTSDQDTVKKISTNGGKTWGKMQTMTGASLNQRDGMVNIAALDDDGKNLIMVYETNEKKPYLKVWATTSSDGGKSWGHRRLIFDPETTTPKRVAGGPGIANFKGTLVVSFMTDQDDPKGGVYPGPGTDMKVITSTDKGKSWSKPTTVMRNGTWGGITNLGDGLMVLAAHDKQAYGQKITVN